jgi:hypothetical protein
MGTAGLGELGSSARRSCYSHRAVGSGPDSARRLSFLTVLPLYVALATAMGFVDHKVRRESDTSYAKYVPSVLTQQEAAPAKYRVLAPVVYDRMLRMTGGQPENVWLTFRWLCLFASFLAGHLLFRAWFSTGGALAGNAIVAALLPLTFTNSWGHPDHLMELFLFALGCACIARRWLGAFLVVLAVATLNRETAFLLVVVFAGAESLTAARWRWIAAASAVWAAVYLGLRWRLGFSGYNPLELGNNIWRLFEWPSVAHDRDLYYRLYGWFFLVLLAAPAAAVWRSWRAQPRFTRGALALATPLFVGIGVTFSSVIEPRIFTPLLPLLAAGLLFAMLPPEPR